MLHDNDEQIAGRAFKIPVILQKPRWRVSVVWIRGGEIEDGRRDVGRVKNLL